MANDRYSYDRSRDDRDHLDRVIPDPNDMLELVVATQRLGQQVVWQMAEVMAEMMSLPLRRDRHGRTTTRALNRAVSDFRDALDGATEILQQGGKPR